MAYQPATQDHVVFCFDVLTHSYRRNSTSPAISFAQAYWSVQARATLLVL